MKVFVRWSVVVIIVVEEPAPWVKVKVGFSTLVKTSVDMLVLIPPMVVTGTDDKTAVSRSLTRLPLLEVATTAVELSIVAMLVVVVVQAVVVVVISLVVDVVLMPASSIVSFPNRR
jgi:hypothetical protein